jgi:hypothetical protein
MEGLQMQLQKSLTENTLLEDQLKDQERQNRQKQKEVDDLRQAAVNFEDRRRGFNEVLDHFQKTLLGNLGSPYFAACANILSMDFVLQEHGVPRDGPKRFERRGLNV